MKFKYLTIIAIAILFSILIIENVKSENELKTDLKIITKLSNEGFMTPALTKNSTFVYCNFEFHMYSNKNNTEYRIIVDNITIANKSISHFKAVFYWNTSIDYIDLLEIYISENYYSYSNIFVFSYSVTNKTKIKEDPDLITFTKEEFKNYMAVLKTRMWFGNVLAWIMGGGLAFYYVKNYKKYQIKVVA